MSLSLNCVTRNTKNEINRFVMVPVALINDREISTDCKQLICSLLTNADTFVPYRQYVLNLMSAFWGRTKTLEVIQEAIEAGYLDAMEEKKGNTKRIYYHVYDTKTLNPRIQEKINALEAKEKDRQETILSSKKIVEFSPNREIENAEKVSSETELEKFGKPENSASRLRSPKSEHITRINKSNKNNKKEEREIPPPPCETFFEYRGLKIKRAAFEELKNEHSTSRIFATLERLADYFDKNPDKRNSRNHTAMLCKWIADDELELKLKVNDPRNCFSQFSGSEEAFQVKVSHSDCLDLAEVRAENQSILSKFLQSSVGVSLWKREIVTEFYSHLEFNLPGEIKVKILLDKPDFSEKLNMQLNNLAEIGLIKRIK